ncbi:hypothetical protein [Halobacterium rubrum]|uniref:hypothetical protein n=1 Tax=Halobacterium TaxID=2239 RepID=UPI001F2E48ED|nr:MULTISPECIES: hypothetical protein [Halobacterium]MDH5019014.1 hypothetical protein [Halobacterium rubrum]
MTAKSHAGNQARTTRDASLPQESTERTPCDDCGVRDAEGMNPPGRSLCRPCARRAKTLIADGGHVVEDDEDDVEVTREMFERGIEALRGAEHTLDEFQSELTDIDTGLTHSNTVSLLYGRPNDLTKTNIRNGFETFEDLEAKSTRYLLKRLLADEGSLTIKEADAFLQEVERLEQRYGGENDD